MNQTIRNIQLTAVMIVLISTIVAFFLEMRDMYMNRDITLADLLLMFIYIEVIGLVRSYWETRAVRITYPLVIAITALARFIILQDKERIMPEYAELVYNGYWFSKKRIKLQKIIDRKRSQVTGEIILSLYKGNVTILSRRTKNKAYSMKKVSFEENKSFNKNKVEKFIKYHSKQLNKA